jgi:hypothetical protein
VLTLCSLSANILVGKGRYNLYEVGSACVKHETKEET